MLIEHKCYDELNPYAVELLRGGTLTTDQAQGMSRVRQAVEDLRETKIRKLFEIEEWGKQRGDPLSLKEQLDVCHSLASQ